MRKAPRRTQSGTNNGEQGFWPSYTDMMSAVALILFFLMLLAYIQNIITNNNLRDKESELRDTLDKLIVATQQVKDKESELQNVTDDLETAQKDLDQKQLTLDEQADSIVEQANYILQQQADIAAQKETIAQQQQYLQSTQAELSQVRSQMQAAAFLRVDIVEKIRQTVEQAMGSSNSISVSETGSLVLSESVLFDQGRADLKANSRQLLDQLAIGFASFLENSDSLQYVDTIVIGGHADSTGSDSLNRKLSTDRANAVLSYLMTTQNGILTPYSKYFCAAGYSSTRPVASNDTPEGRAQNRRIEVSITLKDESVLDALNQYLAIQVPGDTQE